MKNIFYTSWLSTRSLNIASSSVRIASFALSLYFSKSSGATDADISENIRKSNNKIKNVFLSIK